MRKFILGLLGVGLMAVGTPAMAQTADPLGLISSGAVIPFVGSAGAIAPLSMSFIELASPAGDNSGANNGGIGGTHMFFFDTSCVKGPASVGIPLTTNDFTIQRVDQEDSNAPEGLIAIGGVDSTGFFLQPLESPIHVRVLWFDAVTNTMRVLEPIGLENFEGPTQTWNPLRTGADFVALPEGTNGGITSHTTIYLVCPTTSVAGPKGVFPNPNSHGDDFPILSNTTFGTTPIAVDSTGILVRVYGDDEKFLRNGTTSCSCLTSIPVTKINGAGDIYGSAQFAPFGTLTEIETQSTKVTVKAAVCGAVCPNSTDPGCAPNANKDCQVNGVQSVIITPSVTQTVRPAFTGYRGMIVTAPGITGSLDIFGRLSNGSAQALEGGGPDDR